MRVQILFPVPIAFCLCVTACASTPPPETAPPPVTVVHDTVYVEQVITRTDTVADPETRARLSQMEAELLAAEARIQILEEQVAEAQREVVRTMARSQTVASRAEAASGIAEAELAIRTLRAAARGNAPEATKADGLLEQSNEEFQKDNFAGALYLASQARTVAAQGADRVRRAQADDLRPGETPFAVPLRMRTTTRSNVRDGPSTRFRILVTLDADTPVVGTSYVEGWVRITDDQGRSGWIARSLVDLRD
jgi:hypothetical protein